MPTLKENPFLKRYLEAAQVTDTPTKGSTHTASVASSSLHLSDSDIDETMAAEILPLLQTILSRLDKIEHKIATGEGSGSSSSSSGSDSGSAAELPKSIRGFDSYMTSFVDPFVAAANKLGGDAQTVGNITKEVFVELRAFLLKASACKEPPQASLPQILAPIAAKMKGISAAVQRNEWEKHTKTVSEGLGAVNWVMVKPAPRDFIESFIGGSDYWANGIRKEYRTTNPDQMAYVDTFKTLLIELMAYVKEFHTTGVTWNPKGVDISEYQESGAAAPKAAAAAPAAKTAAAAPAAKAAAPATGVALFSALNKGENITSGLKTVTKDMQTWRSEYKGGDAPAAPKVVSKVAPRVAETVKGTPKLEFESAAHKWVVEYQSTPVTVTINDKKETVYIFGCIGASIEVTGKCKSIVVDSCKKTKVYFENAMASVEVVNSNRMEIHCREKVPSVAIDKTDGIVVHLPASSLDSSIVASKSSEMNISFPDPSGEIIERPIPEQYVHRINGLTVTAEVSDLYGH